MTRLAVAVLLVVAVTFATRDRADAATRCASTVARNGVGIERLQATHASCGRARSVARSYLDSGDSLVDDWSDYTWSCSARAVPDSFTRVSCRRGAKRVTFRAVS